MNGRSGTLAWLLIIGLTHFGLSGLAFGENPGELESETVETMVISAEEAEEPSHAQELIHHELAVLEAVAEFLAGVATAAETLDDSAGNGDIQLAGGGGSSLMDAVEATDVQPSPGTSIDLLSTADIARILGIGERSVRRWRSEGALPPAIEIGRSSYWKATVIEQWIDDGCPTPS